jgi:hypothetical protein
MEELSKLRTEKLNTLKIPLFLSINNKNVDKYLEIITNTLKDENFDYIKKVDNGLWSHFIFDPKNVNLNFNQLKKKLKIKFPNIDFQENTSLIEWLNGTNFTVNPHFENELIFEHFELWVQFERV